MIDRCELIQQSYNDYANGVAGASAQRRLPPDNFEVDDCPPGRGLLASRHAVDDQGTIGVTEVVDDVITQVVTHGVDIPVGPPPAGATRAPSSARSKAFSRWCMGRCAPSRRECR